MNKHNQQEFYRQWDNIKETKKDGTQVLRLPEKITNDLKKKQYGVFGHSAVQICGWTKKSLNNKGVCYKQKFYGIECHSCMEFSPAAMWCQQNCTFCWRPMEFMKNIKIDPNQVDEPKEIIDNLLKQRKKLLSGFNINHGADIKKLKEAQTPSHFAISLSGEPTMYPHLDKIIEYLKELPKTKSIFLVTNAQIPEFFEKLKNNKNALPTQIYISLDAPNKELFDKVNISLYKDGWQRLNKSLEIFSELNNTRKLIRFTQIKGLNDKDKHLESYKELIEKAKPDFIEIKAYMHLGMSQTRHTKDQMPEFTQVLEFAKKMANYLENYDYIDSAPNSRIALLRKKDSKYNVFLKEFDK